MTNQPIAAGSNLPSISQSDTRRFSAVVYLHGICEHDAGYSDKWWTSLAMHLDEGLRAELAACRKEVNWTRHVTSNVRAIVEDLDRQELAQLQSMMHVVLEERIAREASEQIAESYIGQDLETPIRQPVNRSMLGIPGLDCIDDFVKYLVSESIRERVVEEATSVLQPLLAEGRRIELFSHSWGTVVAYEALHRLSSVNSGCQVQHWFTIGSALAISFVAKRVRPSSGIKPAIVKNWINLDAKGDAVGGSVLSTGMQADQEYLRLPPIGCSAVFGIVSLACAHSSYFHPENLQVNRDIFAKWLRAT